MIDCEQFLYSHKSGPGRIGERAKREANKCAESGRLIRLLAPNTLADGTVVKDYY